MSYQLARVKQWIMQKNLTLAQIKIDAHEASKQALLCSATRHWCINIAAQIFTFSEHRRFTVLSSGPSSLTRWCQRSSHPQSQRILLFCFSRSIMCYITLWLNSLTFSTSFLLKAKKPNYTFSKYICSIRSMTEPKNRNAPSFTPFLDFWRTKLQTHLTHIFSCVF